MDEPSQYSTKLNRVYNKTCISWNSTILNAFDSFRIKTGTHIL